MIHLAGPGSSSSHYELVTASGFKTFYGISGTTDDALIGTIVNGVNRTTHRELGGRFILSTGVSYEQIIDGPDNGGRELFLAAYPIVSVSAVDWVRLTGNGTYSVILSYQATDYQISANGGRLIALAMGWPAGRECIHVTYQAGFSSVPADLTEALSTWVAVKYQRIKSKRVDALSIAEESSAITFTADDMPQTTRRVLDGYRYIEASLL